MDVWVPYGVTRDASSSEKWHAEKVLNSVVMAVRTLLPATIPGRSRRYTVVEVKGSSGANYISSVLGTTTKEVKVTPPRSVFTQPLKPKEPVEYTVGMLMKAANAPPDPAPSPEDDPDAYIGRQIERQIKDATKSMHEVGIIDDKADSKLAKAKPYSISRVVDIYADLARR